MNVAVILFNLGGPDKLENVEPFLFNLFNDPAILNLPSFIRYPLAKIISKRRAPVAKKIYQELGGASPILKLTQEQASSLEKSLNNKQKRYKEVNITFENASFSYDEKKILDNINLNLPARGLISIEGESGAGKTTFVDLLLGFYDLDSGKILINKENLSDNKENIRACSGYVEQESFIFHNSVFTNIAMEDPNISREQAIASLNQAKANEFINNLENGIDSDLGESGSKLSGGQKQRIAIARALVRDPKILILDEFTSALDKKTSEELMGVMRKISKSILVVAITHDKSVVDAADHKYEIRNGNIFKK